MFVFLQSSVKFREVRGSLNYAQLSTALGIESCIWKASWEKKMSWFFSPGSDQEETRLLAPWCLTLGKEVEEGIASLCVCVNVLEAISSISPSFYWGYSENCCQYFPITCFSSHPGDKEGWNQHIINVR